MRPTRQDRIQRRLRKHARKHKIYVTANFVSLPVEIFLDIAQHLCLPDLEALSASCRRLRNVFSQSLYDEQAFARENLRDLTLTRDDYGYHDFLLGILKREINPNYVRKFDCREVGIPYFRSHREDEEQEIDVARYIGWTPGDISLVRIAIVRSTWLKNIMSPDEFIEKMLHGDEEAVLALLVPLMKNLSLFLPPTNSRGLLPQVFVKIARAQIVAKIEDPETWLRLPLHRLHKIVATVFHRGVTLSDTIHYMSLPCVQSIFFDSINDDDPKELRALNGIPRSRASTVYIGSSDLFRNVAEVLADYFVGPCTIRQRIDEIVPDEVVAQESWVFERFTENGVVPKDPMWYYWDHCVISPGRKDEISSFGAKNLAGKVSDESDGRIVDFTLKYRAFHDEWNHSEDSIEGYELEIRRAGIVPSPQWLALISWERNMAHPDALDDDVFMLED